MISVVSGGINEEGGRVLESRSAAVSEAKFNVRPSKESARWPSRRVAPRHALAIRRESFEPFARVRLMLTRAWRLRTQAGSRPAGAHRCHEGWGTIVRTAREQSPRGSDLKNRRRSLQGPASG